MTERSVSDVIRTDPLRDARGRCLDAIADAAGVTADELPPEVLQAIVVYGQECHHAAQQQAHERDTVPAPADELEAAVPPAAGRVGAYRQTPGHVETVPRRRR